VMSTGVNCGQVRGPVHFAFSTSIDPIVSLEQSVTRMAVTTEKEAQSQSGDNRTMGRKTIVPYALYRGHGFISPQLAAQTGFTTEDLELLKQSLAMMFEHDRSAARGQMSPQRCIAFRHESPLGNAPAHRLFERIKIVRKDDNKPPRAFNDYEVIIDTSNLPSGITVEEWV
jgi:CRISPR-associated protein Csd2